MPIKDKEARLRYQREWYARNREKVIAKVQKRKREEYGGICKNCGALTTGRSKNQAAEFCGKPECRRAQTKENVEMFRAFGLKGWENEKRRARRVVRSQEIVSLEDVSKGY